MVEAFRIIALETDTDDGYLVIRYERKGGALGILKLRDAMGHWDELISAIELAESIDKKASGPYDPSKTKPWSVSKKVRKCSDAQIKGAHLLYTQRFMLDRFQEDFETGVLRKDYPVLVACTRMFVKEFGNGN